MVIRAAGDTMTIKYQDGKAFEATLLSRTETTLHLAVGGGDDVMELSNIEGTWVPAVSDPALIRFARQWPADKPVITETERSCSRKLAARLIHLALIQRNERQN
jgi:hypothetical protein